MVAPSELGVGRRVKKHIALATLGPRPLLGSCIPVSRWAASSRKFLSAIDLSTA